MSRCKFCPLEIFWKENNGKMLPFEDSTTTVIHKCPNLHQNKLIVNDDHLLLTQTISRVSALERTVIELEKKLGENKNEV